MCDAVYIPCNRRNTSNCIAEEEYEKRIKEKIKINDFQQS
jgi:hypothetical protein